MTAVDSIRNTGSGSAPEAGGEPLRSAEQLSTAQPTAPAGSSRPADSDSIGEGACCQAVALVHASLGALNVDVGSEKHTGSYGPTTRAAIEHLQHNNALPVTGRFDAQTADMIAHLLDQSERLAATRKPSREGVNPHATAVSSDLAQRVHKRMAETEVAQGARSVEQGLPDPTATTVAEKASEPGTFGGQRVADYSKLHGAQGYVKDLADSKLVATARHVVAASPELKDSQLARNAALGTLSRADVRSLQQYLKNKGHGVGATGVDGKYGPRTHAALQGYLKQAEGTKATVVASPGRPTTPGGPVFSPPPGGAASDNVDATSFAKVPPGEVRVETYKDPTTGYKVYVAVPPGYDGSASVYFPGDGSSISNSLKGKRMLEQAKEQWAQGNRSALVIVEGNRSATTNRYVELARSGRFGAVLDTLGSRLGKLDKVNVLAHSRGGSAIDWILRDKKRDARVQTVSALDSTYWSTKPLIDFARSGGRLNIAFGPRKNHLSLRLVRKLGLELVSGKRGNRHWRSADGRVNVYESRAGHGGIPRKFAGPFIGSSG